jgi:hypothetical protein
MPAEIELIDEAAQEVRINLTTRGDKAGADFDDYSHILIFLRLLNAESAPSGGTSKDNTSIVPLE